MTPVRPNGTNVLSRSRALSTRLPDRTAFPQAAVVPSCGHSPQGARASGQTS